MYLLSIPIVCLHLHVMEEQFELPVVFNKQELHFPAKLLNYGYSYKLEVEIEGTKVLFEPDEERNWRAVLMPGSMDHAKTSHPDLYRSIAEALDRLFR